MSPDDPRHGTYAGYQVHKELSEPICGACKHAGYLYTKRMKLRLARTGSNIVPLGDAAYAIVSGYPVRLLAELTGIADPKLYTYKGAGPEVMVHVKTQRAILGINRADLWTPIGVRRRVRALTSLGHSAAAIARSAGLSRTAVEVLRTDDAATFVRRPTAAAILTAYADLSMKLPANETPRERSVVTRSKSLALRNRWAPPLAWTNIDDPNDTPAGVTYVPASRLELVSDLHSQGANVTEVCRALDISRSALQKWCGNNGMSPVFRELAAREVRGSVNQYMEVAS